jgi:hypothetical protein
VTAATELPLIVGCRYSHFGRLHGRLSPASAGLFRALGRNENRMRVGIQPGWVTVCFRGSGPRDRRWRRDRRPVAARLPCAVQPTLRLGVESAGLLSQPARASRAYEAKLSPVANWRGFFVPGVGRPTQKPMARLDVSSVAPPMLEPVSSARDAPPGGKPFGEKRLTHLSPAP